MIKIHFIVKKPRKLHIMFCNYILRWLQNDVRREMRIDKVQVRADLLRYASFMKWYRDPGKVTAYEVINSICNSISYRRVKNDYIFDIDPSINFPNSSTPVEVVARFIDFGNESIRGCYFITNVFRRYQENMLKYYLAFKFRVRR